MIKDKMVRHEYFYYKYHIKKLHLLVLNNSWETQATIHDSIAVVSIEYNINWFSYMFIVMIKEILSLNIDMLMGRYILSEIETRKKKKKTL